MRDGGIFEGDFVNGEINGKGIRKWANGSVYKGDFKDGEKHGFGEFSSNTGEKYIGEWAFNQRNGKGRKKSVFWISLWFIGNLLDGFGNVTDGSFLNHKPEGICFMKYANGSEFSGNLSKGLKKGTGKFKDKIENSEYEGEWESDQRHGSGLYLNLAKNYKYEGNWLNNVPEILPNIFVLMFPNDDILEMQRVFDEVKKENEKKKPKKQGEEEELFKFVFPEFLEYELGGPPLRTIEIHCDYQGPDILDSTQPTKEEIEEMIKQYQKEAKKNKNAPPMPDFSKPRMISPKPVIVSQESGRAIRLSMLKYTDLIKKAEDDPANYKTFRVDYRSEMKQKREDNEKLKEEIAKRLEEEAKQEIAVSTNAPKKGNTTKGKKEPKKEEVKMDDLNRVLIYKEAEEEKNKTLRLKSENGVAKIEALEYPDDFPTGRYTFVISNEDDIFGTSIPKIAFDLVINPAGGDDKKKKKK